MTTPAQRLSHLDLDALNSVLPELYATTSLAALPKKMLTLVSRLVPAKVTTYDHWTVDATRCATGYSGLQQPFAWDLDRFAPVLAVHIQDHPLVPVVMQKQTLIPVKITDFVTQNQFLRTGIYNEVYREFDVNTQMALTLAWQPRSRIYLVFNRKGRDFSERDRQVLALLRPHLQQALANAIAWDEAQQYERVFRNGCFGEEREIIRLGPNGQPQSLSKRGEQWLKDYFSDASSVVPFPESLRCWIQQQTLEAGPVENNLTRRRPLILEHNTARLSVTFFRNGDGTALLLLTERRRKPFEEIAQSLPLTNREREVFHWICEVKSNSEIATILGLSQRTVHKHVEHILEKLGVESRLQIQRLGWEMQII